MNQPTAKNSFAVLIQNFAAEVTTDLYAGQMAQIGMKSNAQLSQPALIVAATHLVRTLIVRRLKSGVLAPIDKSVHQQVSGAPSIVLHKLLANKTNNLRLQVVKCLQI